ncbi:MAG: PKD domain-containing protein [Methanobacteriota archaeon]|nr:MAG: PKD domain-containing protein [Euryarchaeota archaeon]
MAQTAPTAPMEPPSEPGLRRKQRRLIAYILVAIIVVAILAATAYVLLSARAPPTVRALRIGLSGQTAKSLNPNVFTLTLEFVVVYNVYSTLATRDGAYHVVGDLANKWEVASDNVTWTFHLVHNAYFTDPANPTDRSHPVTADDVVFSYNMVNVHNGSVLNSYVSEVDSVTKIDTYTVQIVTTEPFAAIDSMLTAVTIFPKYLWESITDPIANAPPVIVGSGPLYFDTNSNLASGPIILHRNPNYYGDTQYCNVVRPDEIRFIFFSSAGAMASSFTSGSDDLDVIYNIPAPVFLGGLTPGQGQAIEKKAVAGGFVGEIVLNQITPAIRNKYPDYMNGTSSPLLLDPTVRKAVAMSIDKASIVKYAYLGLATVADTLVPASNPWHYTIPAADRFPFNTAAARKLLNDAGWNFTATGLPATPTTTPLYRVGGTEPLRFRFYTPDSHPEFAVASANITTWLRQAGIETVDHSGSAAPGYEVRPLNTMNDVWKSSDFDMWLWDWVFSPISDPSTDVLSVQTTDSIPDTSDSWYSNATYDDLYNQSLVTIDPVARRAITDEMQRMLYDNAAYILPYYAQDLYATTSSKGYGYGWENWGDWTQQPGLVPDSDSAALWFRIYPHENPPPTISSFPSISHAPGSAATISVTASDPNDATLTYTWDFGDGSATQTTSSGTATHTYATSGNYTVSVRVKDAEWPTCATTIATIQPGAVAPLAADFSAERTVQFVPAPASDVIVLLVPGAIVVAISLLLIAAELGPQRNASNSKTPREEKPRTRGARPP